MKRTVSLLLSLIIIIITIIISAAVSVSFTVYAEETPYIITDEQHGRILKKVYVYSVELKNETVDYTKTNGRISFLDSGQHIDILGKNKKDGLLFYIRFLSDGRLCYGYVNNYYVCVENKYNYNKKRAERFNGYYKKRFRYKYYTYNGMPFFQYNQTGKGGAINGLKIAYSCGPHAIAAACSALYGDVITPESLMNNMSGAGVYASGNGSRLTDVERGLHSYIEKTYNLKYECKNINPDEAFDYLKKGYMVIYGVENLDGLKTFTALSHYILLVGYDSLGNIMTVNSNLKSNLFDSFSEARIRKNSVRSRFYKENTLAVKYKYNDEFEAFSDEVECILPNGAEVSEHYDGMGRFAKLKKGNSVSVIGIKNNKLFVSYNNKGNEAYGFINRKSLKNYLSVIGDSGVYLYDGTDRKPVLSFKDYRGNPVSESEYELSYPEKSSDIGVYRVNIVYKGNHTGENYFEYSVLPHSVSINSLEPNKKSVRIKWSSCPEEAQITDYIIEYSTDKTFENNVSRESVSSRRNGCTVRNLKNDTVYYFRIAASKSAEDYIVDSSWSNIQSAKTQQ